MAAIRLVSLRMTSVQADRADRASTFIRSVDSYLESEITSPFSYKKLTPTAFALRGKCTSHEIDTYIDKLQNDLLEFLFGTEGDNHGTLLFFAGSDVEVAEFVSTTDERAIELARAYQKKLYERLNTSKSVARPPPTPVAGTRNLLFRGILLCPRRVLLSYAVTPETYESQTREDGVRQDVDLGTYLAFRGEEAVEFSIRIFNKVSYLLQTGDDHVRRSVFVVPLSYKSLLAGQDRRRFLDNIHQHPDWVRQNMILSVFRCPPTPGSSILQRFSGEFTPLFRTIDWQITDPDFAMQVFTGCHFHSLTFDMHTLRPNQRQKALTKFLQRTEDLRAMKLRPAISGVETRAELDQCLNHGVVYASGDAVTAALPSFAPAQTIELRDLPISEPTILDLGTSNAA
ncbi:MAG: hypothetical protein CMK09_03630 [Ponticaulis sp.]|nr:hypothetical protein [Ponticaulis sp.]|tara:strand:+ start:14194 stop:15393 length:1200 start_codon:yes stop_codon:yes gene_type:complete